MKTPKQSIFHLILGVVLLLFLVWISWRIASAAYQSFYNLKPELAAAIIAGSTTVFAAVVALVLGRHYEAKEEREVAHREKKVLLYEEFTGKLFQVFSGDNTAGGENQEMVAFFRETQRKLILWSGPKVVVAFAKWHQVLSSQGNTPRAEAMMTLIDFLLALREDLGHSNKGIDREHILRFLLKNPDLFLTMYIRDPSVSFAEVAEAEKLIVEKA